MVDYTTWVGIVRTQAGKEGADLSEFSVNSDAVALAAAVWRDREELKTATKRQAQQIAEQEIQIR